MEMVWGFAPPLILEAAVRHGVFDALDGGPKTLDQLVAATGASARGLKSIADALVGFKFLSKNGDTYALTPESQAFLVTHKPGFQGAILKHMVRDLIPNWLALSQIVKTGQPSAPVNQEGPGSEFFVQLVEDIFPMSVAPASVLAESMVNNPPTPFHVLDIASGSGVWGICFAKRSPQVHVTAVDWHSVLPVTRKTASRHGVLDQFKFVEGDILTADLGTGHHVATLGHILHSEGAERSQRLLKRVFDALAPGGTIAVAEFVPDDDRCGPPMPLIFGVNMLVNTDKGDVFTFAEMSAWLNAAGFERVRKFNAPGPSPLILADKPKG